MPGDRVVCVDAEPIEGIWQPGEELAEGQVYTIKAIRLDWEGDVVVDLMEVARAKATRRRWGPTVGYGAFRFRPVEDIEQFRRIVANAPRERVDA
jgi:hypothetical protein